MLLSSEIGAHRRPDLGARLAHAPALSSVLSVREKKPK